MLKIEKVDKQDLIDLTKSIFENNLLQGHSNWKNVDYRFIAPANKEYTFQFLWDTAFHAIVLSHFDVEWAKSEIRNFLIAQWDDGFLPHIIFWGNQRVLPHWAYIESKLSPRPHTTAITQPSVFPIAVEIIYQKDKDKVFLGEVLPKIAAHQRWLIDNRDPDEDGLVSLISPNESGMDESPMFQSVFNYLGNDPNRLHYYYRKGDLLNQYFGFNSKKILKKDYFNIEELLFNVIFIEANRSLSRLFSEVGNEDESKFFDNLAKKSEDSLLEKCWDHREKIFYSLYTNQEKRAQVKTIASLFPLFLANLGGEQLSLLVNKHLLNPDEFWTNYPVPSVAKNEPFYDPGDIPFYKGKLIWRGPAWIATNWFIVKGLQKHGYDDIAGVIISRMLSMISAYGFREYYNPETGEGYRRENFGWSTLILDLID